MYNPFYYRKLALQSSQSNRSHAKEEEAEALPSPQKKRSLQLGISEACQPCDVTSEIAVMSTSFTFIPCVDGTTRLHHLLKKSTLVTLLTEEIDTQRSVGAKPGGLIVDNPGAHLPVLELIFIYASSYNGAPFLLVTLNVPCYLHLELGHEILNQLLNITTNVSSERVPLLTVGENKGQKLCQCTDVEEARA